MSKRYQYYDCDDPYKILAINLIATRKLSEVKRMADDKEYLIEEAVDDIGDGIDLSGNFSDCVVDLLLSSNVREWKTIKKGIVNGIVRNFDTERAQRELHNALADLGLL